MADIVAVITGTTIIGRPPQVVFDCLTDPRHEPAYNPVVVSAAKLTPGPIGPGTRFVQQMRPFRFTAPVHIELVEYDPPSRLRWHITSTGMDVHGDIRVGPSLVNGSDGSTVEWRWLFRPRGWLRLAGPLATWTGARLERGIWRRLKTYLEADHDIGAADRAPTEASSVRRRGRGLKAALARLFPPQNYAAPVRYRRPAPWYRQLNRLVGVPLTSLGLAPRDAVTLEVRGRRSGRPRRTPVLITEYQGARYLVALAGESHWVRNVRASNGHAVLHRRGANPVRLEELPVQERPPVLAAYLAAARRRSGDDVADQATRDYFGLDHPTLDDLTEIADRYPVFRVAEIAPGVFRVGPWGADTDVRVRGSHRVLGPDRHRLRRRAARVRAATEKLDRGDRRRIGPLDQDEAQ